MLLLSPQNMTTSSRNTRRCAQNHTPLTLVKCATMLEDVAIPTLAALLHLALDIIKPQSSLDHRKTSTQLGTS
eukprot:10788999-Ditylum_brightwellii.AAC.1